MKDKSAERCCKILGAMLIALLAINIVLTVSGCGTVKNYQPLNDCGHAHPALKVCE